MSSIGKTVSRITSSDVGKVSITALQLIRDASDVFTPLKSVAGATLAVIDLVQKFKVNAKEWREFGERVAKDVLDLENSLQKYDDIPDDLKQTIERLSLVLEGIQDSIAGMQDRSMLQRAINVSDDRVRLKGYEDEIRRALDKFNVLVNIGERMGIHRIEKNQQHHASEAEQQNLLSKIKSSLPHANAAYNSNSREGASPCFQGTRDSILQEIYAWVESADSNSPSIFWLSGLAGMGKSTIAHTVAEHYGDLGKLGASFFFSRDFSDRGDASLLFTTIAYQLSKFSPEFRSHLAKVIDQDTDGPDPGQKTIRDQLRDFIAKPLQLSTQLVGPIVVVVDALDECSDELRVTEVLKVLAVHLPSLPFLKFLITSRPEYRLYMQFESQIRRFITCPLVLHDMEKSVVQADIKVYLKHRLEEVLGVESWPTEKEIDALAEMSSGLFIFASTVVKFIEETYYDDPERMLDAILRSRAITGLSPYRDLDVLYLHVLKSAIYKKAGDFPSRLQSLIATIVLLRDPLPVVDLGVFLGLDGNLIVHTLKPLHSILVVPQSKSECIRVIHASFPDFLTWDNPRRCEDPHFFVDTKPHHDRLAILCFECMAAYLKRDICNIGHFSETGPNTQVNLDFRINECIPAALRYACKHWAWHLSQGTICNPHVVTGLEIFCEVHLLWWLEVLSLLKLLDVALSCALSARNHFSHPIGAQPDPVSFNLGRKVTNAIHYLSDVERFVLAFFEPIKAHPSHIYYSALPFSPVNNLFSSTYNPEAKASLQVAVGRNSDWGVCLRTIEGHGDWVRSVTCSKDGMHIVSSSDDNTMRLWDTTTGAELARFDGHTAPIVAVAISSDGTRVASGSQDKTARIWDVLTQVELCRLEGHSNRVTSVAFSEDSNRIVSGSRDSTVIVWDVRAGVEITKLTRHSSTVTSVTFSSDCHFIASGSYDKTIRIWDLNTSTEFRNLKGHTSGVTCIAFAEEGDRLISGSVDGTARVWDVESGTEIFKLTGHKGIVTSVTLTRFGRVHYSCLHEFVAYGSDDRSVHVWDLIARGPVVTLVGHTEPITGVKFSRDGRTLISGSEDGTIRVWGSWDLNRQMLSLHPAPSHLGLVGSIAFSQDGSLIASASDDKTARVQSASGNVITLTGHTDTVASVAFSSDSLKLVTASDDHTARVWDPVTGAELVILRGHTHWVTAAIFTPDGNHVVSASKDRTVRIWDWPRGREVNVLEGHNGFVESVAVSFDGGRIVSGSADQSVRIWDFSTSKEIMKLEGQSEWVSSVAFSPDGTRIVCATDDETVRVWDATSGSLISEVEGDSALVPAIASGEPHYIASGPWITRTAGDGTYKRIAWLPADCRAESQASHGQRMAIGTTSGKLLVLDFSNVSL